MMRNFPFKEIDQLTEGKVQGLGGEVTDDIGSVSSPERD